MSITPSGKIRVMVAQSYGDPLSEGFNLRSIEDQNQENSPSFETESALNEGEGDFSEESVNIDNNIDNDNDNDPMGDSIGHNDSESNLQNESKDNKKTLSNYVFNKLEGWGYPGRRLQEFKSKFVRETVSAEGVKDVQIEIPDKKYPGADGITDTVENSDLKEVSQEVNRLFGLNFNGAERSDGKWTIKFTSQNLSTPEDEEVYNDNLDDVYGNPSKPGSKKNKVASTVQEIFNKNKTDLVKKLARMQEFK